MGTYWVTLLFLFVERFMFAFPIWCVNNFTDSISKKHIFETWTHSLQSNLLLSYFWGSRFDCNIVWLLLHISFKKWFYILFPLNQFFIYMVPKFDWRIFFVLYHLFHKRQWNVNSLSSSSFSFASILLLKRFLRMDSASSNIETVRMDSYIIIIQSINLHVLINIPQGT